MPAYSVPTHVYVGAAAYRCMAALQPRIRRELGMTSEQESAPQPPWSKEARDYVLSAISILREFRGTTEARGYEAGELDAMNEFVRLVRELGDGNDADGLASIAVGFTRLSDMLLDWIQNEADNKKVLMADLGRKFPDYEEPDSYPTEPKRWSDWTGVLLDIEKSVRYSPTVD